jgi:hypothetical protein
MEPASGQAIMVGHLVTVKKVMTEDSKEIKSEVVTA